MNTPAQEAIDAALRALSERTGIEGAYGPPPPDDDGDGWLQLWRGGRRAQYRVEVKLSLRRGHISRWREEAWHQRGAQTVLITRHVSEPLAQELRHMGVPFIDMAGNVYLDDENWLVFAVGASAPPTTERRRKGLSPSVWKVAYVMLRDPNATGYTLRQLAERAGVSHGAAHTAIRAMEGRGWLRDLGRGGQIILDPEGLWRAWEIGYGGRLQNNLFVTQAMHVGHPNLQEWLDHAVHYLGAEALLGGELGAQVMGADIIASTATLHVTHWDAALMQRLALAPAPTGSVTIRRVFGNINHDSADDRHADRLLIRAELLPILDERLDGARDMLARSIVGRMGAA